MNTNNKKTNNNEINNPKLNPKLSIHHSFNHPFPTNIHSDDRESREGSRTRDQRPPPNVAYRGFIEPGRKKALMQVQTGKAYFYLGTSSMTSKVTGEGDGGAGQKKTLQFSAIDSEF